MNAPERESQTDHQWSVGTAPTPALRKISIIVPTLNEAQLIRAFLLQLRERAPRLSNIHLIGAGVESVLPLDWLPPGVRLTNNSGVHGRKARADCRERAAAGGRTVN